MNKGSRISIPKLDHGMLSDYFGDPTFFSDPGRVVSIRSDSIRSGAGFVNVPFEHDRSLGQWIDSLKQASISLIYNVQLIFCHDLCG